MLRVSTFDHRRQQQQRETTTMSDKRLAKILDAASFERKQDYTVVDPSRLFGKAARHPHVVVGSVVKISPADAALMIRGGALADNAEQARR